MTRQIIEKFNEVFRGTPLLYRAPGRINLIGEHTDYNDGFVLPAAIDKEVIYALQRNGSDIIRLYAYDLDEYFESNIRELVKSGKGWPDYLLGVVDEISKLGCNIEGFDCVFGSNIPIGAGLSSSAALETGLAYGLNDIFEFDLDKLEIIRLSQRAENNFVGMNCGIMDQFASVNGKEGHVFRLDCRSLQFEYFPINLSGISILLIDTMVKHSLASSAYNTRRQECEEGVQIISKFFPGIRSLRDVKPEMLDIQELKKQDNVYKRCHYVVHEIVRVNAACDDLNNGRIEDFGQKMYETHVGLSRDYLVSCDELDFLVEMAREHKSVVGARMMGGGFGGCTINLVKNDGLEELIADIRAGYHSKFGADPGFYEVKIMDGVGTVSTN